MSRSRLGSWLRRRPVQAGAVLLALAVLRVGLGLLPRAPLYERVPLSQVALDREGRLLGMTRAGDGQWRHWVPLPEIAPAVIDATLLYEDRWYRWHVGVNPASLVRATWASLTGSRPIGASTITMQLGRRMAGLHTRSILGKLRQIGAALWLDARYSKDEILEAYLNTAPYGGDLEGVFAASYAYFGVAPRALGDTDALTLAVIPQNPNRRGRTGEQQGELVRARAVLWERWRAVHGATGVEELAMAEPPRLERRPFPTLAPHFVRQVLVEQPAARTVATTLDQRMQGLIEQRLAAFFRTRRRDGLQNAAILVVDHRSAEIRALVGSANFHDAALFGQIDGTRAYRSPGSTLKPFVYGLALEQGLIAPETLLADVPIRYADYAPENFDRKFAGPISATQALVSSRNIPALELARQLREPSLYELLQRSKLRRLGPSTRYGASLALGAVELSMRELAALYVALAHDGELRPLRSTPRRARDVPDAPTRLLSPEASFLVLDMLSKNPRPQRLLHLGAPRDQIAWKTGTSWGFRDGWTVGVAGPYVVAVWVGDFAGKGDASFTGLKAAAPLFFDLVEALLPAGAGRFVPPPALLKVETCSLSGALPHADCPHRQQSWYWPGRSPVTTCAIHRAIKVDARGRRACDATRGPTHKEVVEQWDSELRALFAQVGLPRRSLPPTAPECEATDVIGAPPRITSPAKELVYLPEASRGERDRITLAAVLGADATEVFWYAGKQLLGRAAAGQPLSVRLEPGTYALLAVDNLGRSDTRPLVVAAAP